MLASITLLLVCQLVGEILVRLTGLLVPGPVIGMLLLFTLLLIRKGVPAPLQMTAGGLLDHLSLLFVPAGVGVVVHLPLVVAEWPAIATSIIVSTILTIIVTAKVMAWLSRHTVGGQAGGRQ
jgi:holin-like protein